MKRLAIRVSCAAMACLTVFAAAGEGTTNPAAVTRESLTVIQTGPGGETRILTKDVTTPERPKSGEARPEVAADETPRKARVVVVPAIFASGVRSRFGRDLQEQWGLSDPAAFENPGYTRYLVDALVNSRKLDVLEREDLKSVAKELDFGESDYADLKKVVRMGQMLNADYVVIPEITSFDPPRGETASVPYVGVQETTYRGRLTTSVRTVDVKTSRIVSSSIDTVETKTRARSRDAGAFSKMIEGLYAESGMREAARIVDTAYPIKVIALGDGRCVVNRGRGAIQEGELLDVFHVGEMMVDPDTRESLGYQETRVGQVRVTKVDEKTATADVVEGAGKFARLDLCRRVRKAAAPAVPPAPPARLD